MRKIILTLSLITLISCSSAYAAEYYGIPMYCRTQIEYRDKKNIMQQIIEDMNDEGYELKHRSSISLLFEASLRKSNRFNFATNFGRNWFSANQYDWRREEFSAPVYQLRVIVVNKAKNTVEVEMTPVIIWNPGNACQEEIFEYRSKPEKALKEYLYSLNR